MNINKKPISQIKNKNQNNKKRSNKKTSTKLINHNLLTKRNNSCEKIEYNKKNIIKINNIKSGNKKFQNNNKFIWNKDIISSNKKLSRQKIRQLLNDNKVREDLAKKFTEITINKNKKKHNIGKKDLKNKLITHIKIELKIGKDKIKKIKNNINLFKFRFSNVKKCLVYSFFYQGKENKKLKVSQIADDEKEELLADTFKLLENNIKASEQKNSGEAAKKNEKAFEQKHNGEDVKNDEE